MTLFCSEQFAQVKAWHDDMNHQQIGDPAKPGSVMIQFAEMAQPPVRFAAGSDEAGKVLEKVESIRSEPEKWCPLSPWTDGEPYQESEANMPTLSPTLIGTFVVSIVLQAAALSLLPITQGFSRPLPTITLIVSFVAGIWLLARIIATGVPLSILLPVSAAVVPLAVLAVGVTLYGEHASLLRVALLIAACGLIGVASIIR